VIKTSEVFISQQARLDHRSGCGVGRDSQKIKTSEVFFHMALLDTWCKLKIAREADAV
jgi:hypothetical protein